jgi:hypothetical protein
VRNFKNYELNLGLTGLACFAALQYGLTASECTLNLNPTLSGIQRSWLRPTWFYKLHITLEVYGTSLCLNLNFYIAFFLKEWQGSYRHVLGENVDLRYSGTRRKFFLQMWPSHSFQRPVDIFEHTRRCTERARIPLRL